MRLSAIYKGDVYHQRLSEGGHAFHVRAHFFYLDLDELRESASPFSRRRLGAFRFDRSDYFGPASRPLEDCVRDRIEQELGRRPAGAVRLLAQVREFGYVFNPVVFYYCFDANGELDAIMAEITNTPWKERHAYVIDAKARGDGRRVCMRFPKRFHVSPFFDMDQTYDWRFTEPGAELEIHMSNLEQGQAVFHSGMRCERLALDRPTLRRLALKQPVQPLRVSVAIYFHAALLWLKRVPFYVHPDKRDVDAKSAKTLPSDGISS